MKHDWEYKKWKDVLTIINGKNQKNVECDNGQYPIYGSGGIMGHANDYLCPENTTIIGRKGSINKPLFIATKFWNVDTAFGLVSNSSLLNPKYLFYFCCNYNFETLNKAVTIPSLTKNDLLQIGINVPPLSTQQSIVSELDSLSQIIADCKETLKDYDALEQSIFYDMFGDPVKNEKGWEVKKLGEIGFCCSGGTPSRSNPEYFNGDIMWYSAGELNEMYLGDSVEKITETALNNCSAKICKAGSLFVGMYDTAAFKLGIAKVDSCSNQACANIQLYEDNIIWLYFTLLMMKEEALKNRHGARQKNLNLGYIKNFDIPLPPLPLQQDFATKIEAIEQMKAETRDALQEAETLFQARMDYWFN